MLSKRLQCSSRINDSTKLLFTEQATTSTSSLETSIEWEAGLLDTAELHRRPEYRSQVYYRDNGCSKNVSQMDYRLDEFYSKRCSGCRAYPVMATNPETSISRF